MTGVTRLARTSILSLLLIGALSPVPAFASGPPWYFYNQCTNGGRYDYQIQVPVGTTTVRTNGIWWISTVDTIVGDQVYGTTPVGAPGPCGYPVFQGTKDNHPGDLQILMNGVPDGNFAIADNNSAWTSAFDPTSGYGNAAYHFFHIKDSLVYMDGEPYTPATTTEATSTPTGPSSVLFLPGIESSRLYEKVLGIENRRWEPTLLNSQRDGEALYSNTDGSSKNQIYTRSADVLDKIDIPFLNTDIYRTFIEQLKSLKINGKIADYEVFAYDWRVAPDDILLQGVKYDDGVHYLDKELLTLASSSTSGKVTIVAHSNGGLVAKALMQKLEREGLSNKVDKIIFVDVPQVGTPKAISSMLHGDETGLIESGVISQVTKRSISEYMPDAYDLLPSSAYFNAVTDPVIDLSNAPVLKAASGISPNTVSSQADLEKFVTPLSGRVKSSISDTNTPTVLSPILLVKASTLHSSLDTWEPPVGVKVIQIAGWGVPTQKAVVYSEKNTVRCIFQKELCPLGVLVEHNATTTEDGDGTVVIPSETALAATTYYINIPEIAKTTGKYIDHSNITEATAFQSIFERLLSSTTPDSLPLHVTAQKPSNTSLGARLQLQLHSPVSFQVYDQQGRHTGIVHNTLFGGDFLERGIPNVYYYQYGESKFLSLPNDPTVTVKLQGTDLGTFTLDITSLAQGTSQTITYSDIPVSTSTSGIVVPSGNTLQPAFSLDVNGDGVMDTIFTSSAQIQDPLQYVKFIRSTLSTYTLDTKIKRTLDARFVNVQTILIKGKKWDTDDDEGDENDVRKGEKETVRALRKIDRIDTYINKLLKPEGKNKAPKITQSQAITLLDMDGILKRLIK